ncbi:MAG: glycoside hydrolase family 2 TIM barrel-domain containing protein, partial [Pyrinomonadaceae bacterium]
MKKIIFTIGIGFILLLTCLVQTGNAQTSPRVRRTINDNWFFSPGDVPNAEKPKAEVADWERVSLPHTWNAGDAFDDEPGYRRGPGWYRRQLELDPGLRGKRIFLFFEGANQTAEVFVNEKSLGKHIGGYSAFVFDATDQVSFERPNLIAVRVDNTLEKDIPPLDADFTMYGGIYRDVWLVAADPVHFKVTDHASVGVRVETPRVSESAATVKISGTVVNSTAGVGDLEIISTIFDNENSPVARVASRLGVKEKSESDFVQTVDQIRRPKLWSPEEPNLYRVKTVIKSGEKVLDEIENPLGFRWLRFDAEEGFFLNGKYLKLRGTNKHQDYQGLGNAVPDELMVRDLEIIKDNGFNFLRLAHYPQDPAVLEAADRLGILIWEEIPIVNLITISEAFNQNSKTMLRDMIRQHRNHPSIIIWGYMNEIFLRSPKTGADLTETFKLAKELEKICKEEDPTRVTGIAFDFGSREDYYQSGLTSITDIVGWNLYFGWYHDTFEDFGKFIDEQHRRLPDKPLIISEYGANADRRLHSANPKRFDSTVEWQRMFHESYWRQISERKFIAGSAIWNQFDFGSEFRGETIPHINQKGMFTYDRRPKDVSFFYKAAFSSRPVLHIAARDWKYRSGGARQAIDVYTNLGSVELFQNGVSLGKKTAANNKASWEASLADGKNILTAQATENGLHSDTTEVFFADTARPFDRSFREMAVNVGSNADFIDEGQNVWTADKIFRTGGWGFTGDDGAEVSTLRNAFGSLDDPLFQTMREGLNGYRFDVPDGVFEVELRFVEPKFKEKGQRVFDVKINGQTVCRELDLAGEAGLMMSLTRKFSVAAENRGG